MRLLSSIVSWEWFRGDFESWAAAAAVAGSYADPAILERVVDATRKVRDGEAAYERDGFAFIQPRANRPLLAALAQAAAQSEGPFRIVDFGGALGSLYWQHRSTLAALRPLEWRVVEQDHYVAAGRKEFANQELSFWPDIAASAAGSDVALAVLSSVLQYVPEPWLVLEKIARLHPAWLFFDRLALVPGRTDRLTIEHVPPELGGGSYPAWFLGEERFLEALGGRYRLAERFPTLLEGDTPERWEVFGGLVDNQGFLFRLDTSPAARS
jgi:putative methyltransferase (TIGR04325 family)